MTSHRLKTVRHVVALVVRAHVVVVVVDGEGVRFVHGLVQVDVGAVQAGPRRVVPDDGVGGVLQPHDVPGHLPPSRVQQAARARVQVGFRGPRGQVLHLGGGAARCRLVEVVALVLLLVVNEIGQGSHCYVTVVFFLFLAQLADVVYGRVARDVMLVDVVVVGRHRVVRVRVGSGRGKRRPF